MENISVKQKEETGNRWVFEVKVGEGVCVTVHEVTVAKTYWKKLTGGVVTPAELVRKSFEFLLAREPKESILRKFELPVIQKYFPEYEEEI